MGLTRRTKGLFSTPEEVHAFGIGVAETMCPWPARHKLTEKAEFKPYTEYHYYLAGRATGWPFTILILLGLAKLGLVIFS